MTLEGLPALAVRSLKIDEPPDPLAFLAQPVDQSAPRFFWSAWDDDLVIAASGLARAAAASGPDRLARIGDTIAAANPHADPDAPPWAAPKWLGGFGFSDEGTAGWEAFEPAWFFIPECMLVVNGGETYLTIVAGVEEAGGIESAVREGLAAIDSARLLDANMRFDLELGPAVEKGSKVPPVSFEIETLQRAITAIRDGRAEKVVFATSHSRRMPTPPDAILTLARMRKLQPGCTHFMVSPHSGAALVGATPERLIRVTGDRFDTMALAGTAPRGADEARDSALGSALMASVKDCEEHEHVVMGIRKALSDCELQRSGAPTLRRLATLQHLETHLVGLRPEGATTLSLAARLHPTPALGGSPTRQALRLIEEFEPAGRGWYGGAVGWLEASGDGDLAVAIRALRLTDDTVTAFAGAGLVATSDPEREAREIELKLNTVLSAVEGGLG